MSPFNSISSSCIVFLFVLLLPVSMWAGGYGQALDPDQLAHKKQGWYVTGLPLINFDSDTGLGYGARAFLYSNGLSEETGFAWKPFKLQIYGQYFQSTGGWQYHTIDLQMPWINDSAWSLKANVVYDRNIASPYFGTGSQSLRDLSLPDGRRFDTYASFVRAARAMDASGESYGKYYLVDIEQPGGMLRVYRETPVHGLRLVAGARIAWTRIRDYSGTVVETDAGRATVKNTHLADDQAAGKVRGASGGWDNTALLGIMYDTRDYPPDPYSGWYLDSIIEGGAPLLPSDFRYMRYAVGLRRYQPLPIAGQRLSLATRAAMTGHIGDPPFFGLNSFAFAHDFKWGLGGYRSLRGFALNRFVGDIKLMGNLELRWRFWQTGFAGQTFGFMLVPFVDTGTVLDQWNQLSTQAWKTTGGAGFRIAWNQATVAFADFGFGAEGTGIYLNFEHIF